MIFSIDTETTGLDSFKGDKPFAITTCDTKGKTKYISIGEDDLVTIDTQLMGGNEVIFHNAKFDILMLATYGMTVGGKIHDTMIAAAIHNSDENTLKLKDLAKKYLGVDNDEEEAIKDYMRKHKLTSYADLPRELIEPYARKDALITMELFKFYRKAGVTSDPIYLKEIQLLKCLVDMQRRGVLIDTRFCEKNSNLCAERIRALEKKIKEDHKNINVNSNKQLAEYLFDDQGIRCDYTTEKGNPAFDEFHLSKYEHPIIPIILELRDLQKVKTTYLDALKEKADEKNVIHCDFFQVGARTGRFSCRSPNLQNIPRMGVIDVRRAFVCRDHYSNYYFDYSQIELRILAHYSQEPLMLEEYNKTENDLHSVTCQAVFGEVTKEKRTLSKNINFGIIYGMGPKKFCTMVNEQYPDFNMTYTDARGFINKYYKTYQKVRTFTWRVPQKILDVGYVKDIFGRKYTTPRDEAYKGVNYLIQGCAAGIIKKAMIEIHDLLEGKKSNMLLTIHDELVIEIHEAEEELVEQIKEIMEDRETFRVPITVNIEKTSTCWAEKD
jgi:DNA polymerase-1